MTDYSTVDKTKEISSRKDEVFNKRKIHTSNEKGRISSKKIENDSLVKSYTEFRSKFRPDVAVKDPQTFSFYGSAEKYYDDASYNIINYYPFDGTREEVIAWYTSSAPLDDYV